MFESLQASISDDMLRDILNNFREGGSVKALADYYMQCIKESSVLIVPRFVVSFLFLRSWPSFRD